MYDYDDSDACGSCGQRDYGFDMPDTRSSFEIVNCGCKAKCLCTDEQKAENEGLCLCSEEADGCQCERDTVKIRIHRVYDKTCEDCGSADWRPEWQVIHNGKVVATVPSEAAAEAVVEAEYPEAEGEAPDPDWESERWLRRAEGWGC